MIQHATTPATAHRVECLVGRPKLISLIQPSEGHTAWCRGCKEVHLCQWEDYPRDVLREIVVAINAILAKDP